MWDRRENGNSSARCNGPRIVKLLNRFLIVRLLSSRLCGRDVRRRGPRAITRRRLVVPSRAILFLCARGPTAKEDDENSEEGEEEEHTEDDDDGDSPFGET